MGIENYHYNENVDNTILDKITEVDEMAESFNFQYNSCILLIANKLVDGDYDYNEELLEYYTKFKNEGRNVDWNQMVEDVEKKVISIKKSLGIQIEEPKNPVDQEQYVQESLDRINKAVSKELLEEWDRTHDIGLVNLSGSDLDSDYKIKTPEEMYEEHRRIAHDGEEYLNILSSSEQGDRGQR